MGEARTSQTGARITVAWLLLGDWNPELDEEAKLAVAGEFWQTGKKIALERRRTEEMPLNTSYYGHQKEK